MSIDEDAVFAVKEWVHLFFRNTGLGMVDFSRRTGLSMGQLGALFRIFAESKTGISRLGDELGISSAGASQMLDKLAAQGLVERTEDPSDRRARKVLLTDKGRAILREGSEAREGWIAELVSRLDERQKETVRAAFTIMASKASELQGTRKEADTEGERKCYDSQNF
jgi:DNA-binding MarR family transcriptional regulator